MKNKIILAALVMMVSFYGCKKTEAPAPVISIVKSVSQNPGGTADVYTYDAEGRVQRIQNSSGGRTDFAYAGDTVIETAFDFTGDIVSIKTLLLNGEGLVYSSVTRDTLGNKLSSAQYIYDANKFKTEQKDYNAVNIQTGLKKWTITAENNIGTYESSDTSVNENNYSFWYIYSLESFNTIGNENTGQKYYGVSSKNSLKVLNRDSYYLYNIRYTYLYTLDGSGRTLTMSAYDHQMQLVYTNTHTYY